MQINTLPQWDRICPDLGLSPFLLSEDGSLDYSVEPNMSYWERAKILCRMANEEGFTPALVLCWANIVPNTWLSHIFPTHVWPLEAVEAHVRRMTELFETFAPVYIVSGDTDLSTPETLHYYRRVLELLRELAPNSLRTMHLCGEFTGLPQELAKELDFYTYQSGHKEGSEAHLEELPAAFCNNFPQKPLLNGEPCYERMPKFSDDWEKQSTAEYSTAEVLEACRRSILAGAKAGITYGANGVWNWRRENREVVGPAAQLYANTAVWREALRFPAAEKIAALCELAY